jgi:hypothetical protein
MNVSPLRRLGDVSGWLDGGFDATDEKSGKQSRQGMGPLAAKAI